MGAGHNPSDSRGAWIDSLGLRQVKSVATYQEFHSMPGFSTAQIDWWTTEAESALAGLAGACDGQRAELDATSKPSG